MSSDSLTVLGMAVVLAIATASVFRRAWRMPCERAAATRRAAGTRLPPRCHAAVGVTLAGSTGLVVALWLAEFGSAVVGGVAAAVAAVVAGAGGLAILTTWLWWRPRRLLPPSLRDARADAPGRQP
jgi:hypothetical protein